MSERNIVALPPCRQVNIITRIFGRCTEEQPSQPHSYRGNLASQNDAYNLIDADKQTLKSIEKGAK